MCCMYVCISAAKVNATLGADLTGQPLDGEGKREVLEGSAKAPSLSATAAQGSNSSANCRCSCHVTPVPGATVQVKEEPKMVGELQGHPFCN